MDIASSSPSAVVGYTVRLSVLQYQTAVVRKDFDAANEILPNVPESEYGAIARFLESQGFKAERVRPLSAAEQRAGPKDVRMALLRANIKKWSAAERSGVLQFVQMPCTLPFTASPALAERLAVGGSLVCKVEGKGKDLAAVQVRLPPPQGEKALFPEHLRLTGAWRRAAATAGLPV